MVRKLELTVLDENFGSDHFIMKSSFSIGYEPVEYSNKSNNNFNYHNANWVNFAVDLNQNPDPSILSNVEDLNNFIVSLLMESANKNIPKKTNFTLNSKKLPPHIVAVIKERQAIRKVIRKGKSDHLKPSFNKLTKSLRQLVLERNSSIWSSRIKKASKLNSTRPLWNEINKLRTPRLGLKIPSLSHQNKLYTDDSDKANLFADLLEDTFNSKELYDENFRVDTENSVYRDSLASNSNSYQVNSFSLAELEVSLKNLKSGAAGVDQVSNQMLKNISPHCKYLVLRLFNLILQTSNIPKGWKISKVSMIPKKLGLNPDPSQYRPISLTSCMSKLFESLVHSRIYNYLENRNLLKHCQSGFRKGKSTKDVLLFLTQKVKETLVRSKRALSLSFDISKAFDSVWHIGLISKMIKLKIPTPLINITSSFLSDRSFFVQVGDSHSSQKPITNRVPQGSVLGPLLFLIYINDIPLENFKDNYYSLLYADDLTTFFIFKNPGRMKARVKQYLMRLEKWLYEWRFKLSMNKCTYTIFSNKCSYKERFSLTINNQNIAYEKNPKLLGIIFDESLTFNKQVDSIRDKCLSRLNLIKVLSHREWKLSRETLLMLYKTLIRSIIDYSSFIVDVICDTNLKRLQVIQNKAVRCIFKASFDTPTSELCSISNLNPIKDRLFDLNKRFIERNLNKVGLVKQLIDEFNEFNKLDKNKCPLYAYLQQ